jgi:YbgC/YbaW family acyl-CoA thioester hydrolase
MSLPADFRFHHRLRVRWAEVDAQQVVFNGHYLTYLDVASSDYWRAVGLPYPEAFRQAGGDIFVRRNTLEYHAPARLDDWLDVGIRCERVGNSSLTLRWAAWCQGRLLVTGEVVYVHTSLSTGRPTPWPEAARVQLDAWERGAAVHDVQLGDWSRLADAAKAVRQAVFIAEQGIPESEEWDDDDARSAHAVVTNLSGLPLATGRLIPSGEPPDEAETHARIGRVAVLRSSRGVGLARLVLSALIAEARLLGRTHLSLHAQVSALPLYAGFGFEAQGPVFDEVGIPHQRMTLRL